MSSDIPELKRSRVIAAVRSDEQAKVLTESGINVLQLDLTNKDAVIAGLLKYNSELLVRSRKHVFVDAI